MSPQPWPSTAGVEASRNRLSPRRAATSMRPMQRWRRGRRGWSRSAGRAAAANRPSPPGWPFTGLWLDAPADRMAERIDARRDDASDASPAVLAQQLATAPGDVDWIRIDASGDPNATLAAARRALSH